MLKIGFSGIPGTGKTTQANALIEALKINLSINAETIKEYARTYLLKHGNIENIWEEYRIFDKQLEWEESIIKSSTDMLITDSPLPLIFMYATDLHNNNNKKEDMLLQDILKKELKANNPVRYDIIFHCPDVLNINLNDGTREITHINEQWRIEHEKFVKSLFLLFKPKKFIVLDSLTIKERTTECINHINNYINK